MRTIDVDVAIIGAGTAGLNARREVERRDARSVLIEGGPYGTTCARVGCMPSKLMIAAADAADAVRKAAVFGIQAEARIDGRAVMARVQRERDRFVGATVAGVERIPEAERLRGHARFVAPTILEVGDHTRVSARAVVVATGSVPVLPPPFDAIGDHVMTSDDVFEQPDLPESMAVIGTGVIALELGQAMHRLGVRTAFFSPFDEVGPLTDPAVEAVFRQAMAEELDLRLRTTMLAAEPGAGGVTLRWRDADGQERQERFARILVAAGRRPSVAGLNLAATGLPLGKAGTPEVDPETARCGDSPIFFAGDVTGHRPLQHEAADEGRIAGANAALYPRIERHDRRTSVAIVFTDPQVAMVGMQHDRLPEGCHAIGEASYETQGRARTMAANRGLLRVYADTRDGTVVGAEMAGPAMEHIGQLLAWSIAQRMTVPQALAMPYYHPVLETGVRTALRDLVRKMRAVAQCRPEDMEESPGQ